MRLLYLLLLVTVVTGSMGWAHLATDRALMAQVVDSRQGVQGLGGATSGPGGVVRKEGKRSLTVYARASAIAMGTVEQKTRDYFPVVNVEVKPGLWLVVDRDAGTIQRCKDVAWGPRDCKPVTLHEAALDAQPDAVRSGT